MEQPKNKAFPLGREDGAVEYDVVERYGICHHHTLSETAMQASSMIANVIVRPPKCTLRLPLREGHVLRMG